jgi:hypothetical protein
LLNRTAQGERCGDIGVFCQQGLRFVDAPPFAAERDLT